MKSSQWSKSTAFFSEQIWRIFPALIVRGWCCGRARPLVWVSRAAGPLHLRIRNPWSRQPGPPQRLEHRRLVLARIEHRICIPKIPHYLLRAMPLSSLRRHLKVSLPRGSETFRTHGSVRPTDFDPGVGCELPSPLDPVFRGRGPEQTTPYFRQTNTSNPHGGWHKISQRFGLTQT